tara:strand:+ start:1059 stop:2870 length:1812 start_codon:yes stop_codon:yes gene_type:complete
MGRLITTFKDKTFEPSMKSYYQLFSDDTTTAPQIYDSLLYVRGTNAGSLAVGQENDQGPSTVEEYDTYMPVRFYNVKSESDGTTPAGPTHTFFSVYNRAEYAGPINQNMYDVWADYNVAKLSNAGYITNTLGGAYNSAYDNGSGDDQTIPAIYGSLNYAEIQPTGDNRVVTYAQGSRNWVKLNKANATATYVYPTTSEFNQTTGTVGTLAMHKFDLDYTAGAITNAYFIWADESSVPTPSGEAYFIKSNIPWQTLLSGPLTNTGAVTFNSTLAVTGAATFNTSVSLLDNDFLYLGTGTDFRAFHNGTDTYLENSTGELRIMSNDWALRSMSTEIIGYDTTNDYVKFSKDARWIDNEKVLLGTGGDLQVYHDGTNSAVNNLTGDLYIMNASDDKDILFQSDDGSGNLATYFTIDGGSTMNVFSKPTFHGDGVKSFYGNSSDLQIYHDGNNSFIDSTGAGDLYIRCGSDDESIIFQNDDGSGGLETYFELQGVSGGGSPFTVFPDNSNLVLGAGHDMRMYHNGSGSYVDNYTGVLQFTNYTDDSDIIFKSDNGSGGTTAYITLDGSEVSTVISTIKVLMPNLPTSDPSVAGQLWNSSGDLKISAG